MDMATHLIQEELVSVRGSLLARVQAHDETVLAALHSAGAEGDEDSSPTDEGLLQGASSSPPPSLLQDLQGLILTAKGLR